MFPAPLDVLGQRQLCRPSTTVVCICLNAFRFRVTSSSRFEEQLRNTPRSACAQLRAHGTVGAAHDSRRIQVEIDEIARLMRHIGSEVLADYAVPCLSMLPVDAYMR